MYGSLMVSLRDVDFWPQVQAVDVDLSAEKIARILSNKIFLEAGGMERTLCLTPCDLQSMMRAMLADDDKYDSVLDHHTANMHVAPDILGDVESNV